MYDAKNNWIELIIILLMAIGLPPVAEATNYTLAPNIAGQGTVKSADGKINCTDGSGTCSASYPAGTSVQLTATAASGWTFSSWSSAAYPSTCGGGNPCSVTMTQNLGPTATFTFAGPADATFSLPVFFQGAEYDLYFKGDPASYVQLTQYTNSTFGPQAQYLSAFLLSSVNKSVTCCAISGVWVYSGGQPVPTSQIPANLLNATFLWAYGYLNYVLTPGGTDNLQSEYSQVKIAIQNEWVQQTGIVLANLANLATVIGPVTQDLDTLFGSAGANQLSQEIQLISDVLQGAQQVHADFTTCGGSIISTLQNLNLITGPDYDPSSLILALATSIQQNQNGPSIAQALYSAAYSNSCSPSSALLSETVAAKAGDFLKSVVMNVAASSAVQGGSMFAEAYFQYGLTYATAGQIATASAFEDILSCQVPAAIGSAVISNYIMPQAALLQEEVNIQNLLDVAFPKFFQSASVTSMITQQGSVQLANIIQGDQVMYGLGVLYAFQSLWFTTDYQLVSNEACVICANNPTYDEGAATTYATGAQQVLSLIQGGSALVNSIPILSDM